MEYVVIGENVFSIDTEADIELIKQTMAEENVAEVEVWAGDPDSPDTYKNGRKIFAECGQDDLTERRREYHDMLDRDFQRLGLVER